MTRPHIITELEQLREICGHPHPHTAYKVQDRLSEQASHFIQASPFVLLATVAANGEPTISPKGGAAGFVGFDQQGTLYLPDKRGNNLIFSLQNILVNPQVGLIFLRPGTCETLRVHGHARISDDPELCERYQLDGKPARLVTIIELSSAYFHCSLSLHAGKLWQTEHWPDEISISWKEEIEPNLPAEEKARL